MDLCTNGNYLRGFGGRNICNCLSEHVNRKTTILNSKQTAVSPAVDGARSK